MTINYKLKPRKMLEDFYPNTKFSWFGRFTIKYLYLNKVDF